METKEAADSLDDRYESGSKVEEPIEMDTDILCRVCACTSEELIPVFGRKGLELQLLEKIHIHLPIMVTPEDLLPVTLCTSCIYKLEMCHEFVHGCLDADAKLRTFLGLKVDEELQILYSDEHIIEYQFRTSKEPSTETEKEQKLYGNLFEGSAYQTYEDHTQASVKSEDSVDKFDCTKCTEIPSSLADQMNEKEYEDDDFDQHSVDKLNFAKYTKITSDIAEQNTEIDVEGMNEIKYEIDDLDQHSDLLQNHEVQEDSFVQQIHDCRKDAESRAVSMKLRSSRAVRKLKMKTKKPKFKVVIMKVKDAVNTTHTAKFRKTLDLVMTAGKKHLTSNKKQQSFAQQALEHQQSINTESSRSEPTAELIAPILKMPSSVEPSVLSTGDTKYKEVKLQRSASMNADHCYIHAQQSLYCCMYCRKTVTSKDTLISHQVMAHHSKIFHCEQCNTVYYSKELLDKHQRSHFREPKHNTSVKNVESKEKFQTCTVDQLDHDLDGVLPLLKNLAPEESYTDKNILKLNGGEMEEIRVVDVHIAPEKVTQKRGVIKNYSRFHLKLSKEFENIDQNYKSKILETINKITEKNCDNTKIGTITTERTRKEIENELEKPKIAKPKMKMEKNVKKHKIWKCSHCNHVSTSQKQYREHHRTHPPVKLSCSYCDKQFPSQKSLSHHIYIHHTDEKHFICEFCGTSFRFWRSLRDHLFIHDKTESLFQCDRCGREFGSKASYDSHCSSHSEASYLCDVCGKSMKYFTSLWLHRLSHADPSNVPQHSCVICGKIYRSRYFLAVHMQLHTNECPYECTLCGKKFCMRSQLSDHKLIHANARQHKCPVCGEGFNHQQHMRVHIRTHQQSLKYTCKVCKSQFASVGELIMHCKTHTQEEIEEASKQQVLQGRDPLAFLCQICGKQLASKFTLKNHVMMHAGDKPFSCNICGKSFAMKSTLQTHQRVHTGERPHSCQYCGEAFQSKQNLIIHERIHTGEMPFKCTQCDKAYRSRHSLRQHLLFHTDYRPYECPQCSKKFRRQDILSTHMRTHTGERPYACKVCGRAFKQRGDCNKHQQRHVL